MAQGQWFASTFGKDPTAYFGADPIIRRGSSGPTVSKWQALIGVSPADGKFGPATENATKKWQAARGLKADGVVGAQTWAAANQVTVPVTPGPNVPTEEVTAAPTTPAALPPPGKASGRILRLGMSGPDVVQWQTFLGVKPADGKFGPATDKATRAWQRSKGLKVDGVVGPATMTAAQAPYPSGDTPLSPSPSPAPSAGGGRGFVNPPTVKARPSVGRPEPAPETSIEPVPEEVPMTERAKGFLEKYGLQVGGGLAAFALFLGIVLRKKPATPKRKAA